ncbi:unnamed protein product, partial [Aureobasidium vineae]
MMDTGSQQKRKRASRKNTPKRFRCEYEGCTKPKQLFQCQVEGCDQTFVRLDLCMRHQARHDEVSRATVHNVGAVVFENTSNTGLIDHVQEVNSSFHQEAGTAVTYGPPTDAINATDSHLNISPGVETGIPGWMQDQILENHAGSVTTSYQPGNGNFVSWLFDSPGSQQQNFDLSNYLPYVDFGLDYCSPMNDLWQFDSNQGTINASVGNSLAAPTVADTLCEIPGDRCLNSHVRVSTKCRSRIVQSINSFLEKKRPPGLQEAVGNEGLLFSTDGKDLPNLTRKVLENCLSSFWSYVAVQLPVIHQQTFSSDDCQMLLLLAILMLGAGQVVRLNPIRTRNDYRALADLLAINLRWDIFPEAEPPITLWVAQALLLLEFYEKMFSSRRLHERAYIHHASTLALLRRGSPMVGHAEDEEPPTRCPSPGTTPQHITGTSKQLSWFQRWARNESWHRVVFAALHMDTLHAVAFGHESSLLPYEVRLPLPCDDSIWSAQSPEDVWRLEETFSMHGISQQLFLDSLKRCLHGHEVHSNHGARIILGSGLLNIGWQLRRRERNQQFLESIPSAREQERWRVLLLDAYTHWCQSFQKALEKSKTHSRKLENIRDVVTNPAIIYRLAYITSHVDILDAQVYAGSKRLLGRKITDKDYLGCSTRMHSWATTSSARLAVVHAFELLNETLVNADSRIMTQTPEQVTATHYTCRADAAIYRPWVLYLAALTIWSYQYALRTATIASQTASGPDRVLSQSVACDYIRRCAQSEIDSFPNQLSAQGCGAICKLLAEDFAYSEWELLLEASKILDSCAIVILDRS